MKYWQADYDKIGEMMRLIWRMKFKYNGGWITHRIYKLILISILHDYSLEAQNDKRDEVYVHPIFNNEKESIIYEYVEFRRYIGLMTTITLKKYLNMMNIDSFIFFNHLDKNSFEVSINFQKIINAPMFDEAEHD